MVIGGASACRLGTAKPRQVARHGIVELQRSRVAELEDRRRGEELGDGGDAVERVRRGGRVRAGSASPKPAAHTSS
jgi:hypothetical protein